MSAIERLFVWSGHVGIAGGAICVAGIILQRPALSVGAAVGVLMAMAALMGGIYVTKGGG